MAHTLILGWGNPGRGDDGLGPAFIDELAALELPEVDTESGYQLQVEDAATVAAYQRVLFVDADRSSGKEPFRIGRLEAPAGAGAGFTTHSIGPETVLALARDLFASQPEAWVLGIRGYEFDTFSERISSRACANLAAAVGFVQSSLLEGAPGRRVDDA